MQAVDSRLARRVTPVPESAVLAPISSSAAISCESSWMSKARVPNAARYRESPMARPPNTLVSKAAAIRWSADGARTAYRCDVEFSYASADRAAAGRWWARRSDNDPLAARKVIHY